MIAIGYLIVAVLVLFDQLSKYYILNNLPLGQSVTIIPGLIDFHSVYNTGAAFSLFNQYTWLLAIISVSAVIVISFFMKDINFKTRKIYSWSIVLIFSGTFGNMIDRIFNPKGVFDFIEFTFVRFAIFNVADSCLTIGTILLAYYLIFIEGKEKTHEPR